MLVLDAGDALAATAGPFAARDTEKARLILTAMGQLGTAGMAVGERDLALEPAFLRESARRAGVPLLSANLLGPDGKPAFERSRVVEMGGKRVGILAVYAPAPGARLPAGFSAADALRTARDVAFELRGAGVGLVIALVHGPVAVAEQVAGVGGIHLVIPAHEGLTRAPYRPAQQAWVVGAGQKGRDLTRLSLQLEGDGPLADGGAATRAAEEVRYLQQRIAEAKARAGRAQGQGREALLRVATGLESRLKEASARAAARPPSGNSFRLSVITLGDEIPDEPGMAALVRRFEDRFPSSPAAH